MVRHGQQETWNLKVIIGPEIKFGLYFINESSIKEQGNQPCSCLLPKTTSTLFVTIFSLDKIAFILLS